MVIYDEENSIHNLLWQYSFKKCTIALNPTLTSIDTHQTSNSRAELWASSCPPTEGLGTGTGTGMGTGLGTGMGTGLGTGIGMGLGTGTGTGIGMGTGTGT